MSLVVPRMRPPQGNDLADDVPAATRERCVRFKKGAAASTTVQSPQREPFFPLMNSRSNVVKCAGMSITVVVRRATTVCFLGALDDDGRRSTCFSFFSHTMTTQSCRRVILTTPKIPDFPGNERCFRTPSIKAGVVLVSRDLRTGRKNRVVTLKENQRMPQA